jgi:DNA polymerase-3 subunit alpha
MSFYKEFKKYDECAPPGVLLPQINIEPKYYKAVGIPKNSTNIRFLRALCWKNMQAYGLSKKNTDYLDRMTMELEILEELGFIDYILLNWEVLNFCREQNIPTGPGRGSAAGSLVLFFLGVTKVDPIKYNLFFERFVSRSRAKKIKGRDGVTYLDGSLLADVDNDIAYDRRAEVINYIKEKYKGRTCKILNLVTLSGKLCIKEVGKLVALKDEEEMNDISDQIPVTFGKVAPLKQAVEENEKFAKWAEDNVGAFSIALKLEGLIKNTGVHASGIAISHHKLTDICPIQKTKEGDLISCYDMNWIAELTVKFDILGLKTLTVLNDAKNLLKETQNLDINFEEIDLLDDFIYKNLQELRHKGGQGLFQIEADTNFDVCCTVKPRNLEEISAVVAIARPGALEFKDQYASYIRTGDSELVHPEFSKILDSTGGIPLYQEQLMQMAVHVGFTLDEAEQLRRIVGKKKVDQMPEWREKIAKKVEENRLTNAWTGHRGMEIADVLWQVAEDSANYSFNKSHSISYAILSAWTTYVKFKYPQEFFIALLKMAKNESDPFAQISKVSAELSLYDIKLLRPDLVKSQQDFCVEGKDIRYGLNAIKGVSERSLQAILDYNDYIHQIGGSSKLNKFEIFEAAKQAKINIGLLSGLIQAGTLNSLVGSNSRARLVLEAQSYNVLTDREKRIAKAYVPKYGDDILALISKAGDTNSPLMGDDNRLFMKESRLNTFMSKYRPYKEIYDKNCDNKNDDFASWYFEKQLLGYSYSKKLRDALKFRDSRTMVDSRDLLDLNDNTPVKIICTVKSCVKRTSRNDKKYYFIIAEDETGEFKSMFMEREHIPFLQKGKSLPEKDSIAILFGRKSDTTVFVHDINVLDNKIYMKLSDIK